MAEFPKQIAEELQTSVQSSFFFESHFSAIRLVARTQPSNNPKCLWAWYYPEKNIQIRSSREFQLPLTTERVTFSQILFFQLYRCYSVALIVPDLYVTACGP